MTIKITWYSHACFLIETGQTKLLTDPFLSDNPLSPAKADAIEAEYILVSHGHGDHVGDTIGIAKRTGATVISNYEVQAWLANQGVENTHPQHIGGGFDYPWGRVKLTIAHHGSGLPDGSYGGNPCGFLFYIEGKKIYHACDTGLFYDMKLIGEEGIDLAILPIGDNFTMDYREAAIAAEFIKCDTVVGCHYDTFGYIEIDHEAAKKAFADNGTLEDAAVELGLLTKEEFEKFVRPENMLGPKE